MENELKELIVLYGLVSIMGAAIFCTVAPPRFSSWDLMEKGYISLAELVEITCCFLIMVLFWPILAAILLLCIPMLATEDYKKPLIVWKKPKFKERDLLKRKNLPHVIRIEKVELTDLGYRYKIEILTVIAAGFFEDVWYNETRLEEAFDKIPDDDMTRVLYGP